MLWRRCLLCLGIALTNAGGARAFVWPNAAERVERQLASESATERRVAATQIVQLPASVAQRLVPRALQDPDTEVRLAALDAALRFGVSGVSDLVIPWLNHSERRIRMAAIELLRVAPSAAAIPSLGRALSDPDPVIRQSAADALGASKDQGATMHLLSHLDDPMPRVREALARALAKLADPRAVVPLIGKIQDSHAGVRASVARALGELSDPRASPALVLALADQDEEVRASAARALGRLGQDAATLPLVSLADSDASTAVRSEAVRALGAIGSDAAVAALMGYLGNEAEPGSSAGLRVASIGALEALGAKAKGPLIDCLVREHSRVRANGCALVLGRAGERSAVPSLINALRAGRVDRSVGLRALGDIGDPAGLPAALEYLMAPDATVRRAAIEACAALLAGGGSEGRAVEPITAALKAPNILNSERAALARILGLTRSKRAAGPLMTIATDSDDLVLKREAIEALGALGSAGQHQVLLSALDDEEPTVRLAAALALRQAANAATASEILRRLRRAAEQDRGALLLALTGALGANRDPAVTGAVADLAGRSSGGMRDGLLEALGNAGTPDAHQVLARFIEGPASVADRAKIAEALAAHPAALATLVELARDSDGSVRANAAWSLGAIATDREKALLLDLTRDRDVAVAGNAVASLGRWALRAKADVTEPLCALLRDSRSYVRANALGALVLLGTRCPQFVARTLLHADPSPVVREQAAALLIAAPAKDPAPDRQALRHCVLEEPVGAVAARCAGAARARAAGVDSVTVLVVPSGESAPVPRAPFALRRADGLLRLGLTDRRGGVYEHASPSGEMSLMVPAPLAR